MKNMGNKIIWDIWSRPSISISRFGFISYVHYLEVWDNIANDLIISYNLIWSSIEIYIAVLFCKSHLKINFLLIFVAENFDCYAQNGAALFCGVFYWYWV